MSRPRDLLKMEIHSIHAGPTAILSSFQPATKLAGEGSDTVDGDRRHSSRIFSHPPTLQLTLNNGVGQTLYEYLLIATSGTYKCINTMVEGVMAIG